MKLLPSCDQSRLDISAIIVAIVLTTAATADKFPLRGGGGRRRTEAERSESCRRLTESCLTAKQRPVCASDGLTYSSKCDVRRLRGCERRRIAVISAGHCPVERSGRGGCVDERRLATEERTRRHDVYVPRCRADGAYTDEQCHNATGYCWCVTGDGKPIPGSSIRGRQHNCAVYFSAARRVSPRRGSRRRSRSEGRSSRRRNEARGVGARLRSLYASLRPVDNHRSRSDRTPTSSTDGDNTGHSLLDLINSKVSMRLNHTSAVRHVTRSRDQSRRRQRNNVVDRSVDSPNPGGGGGGAVRSRCSEARSRAVQLDRADPEGHIFIPVCQRGGALYHAAQCHAATGYCWCVDEHTGIPIPGLATRNVTPNCSQLSSDRFRVCPPSARRRFLTELFDLLTQQMVASVNNGSFHSMDADPDPDLSLEEQAVRWKLRQLDSNKNNVLERRELKSFRSDIRALRADDKFGRKCRRLFLRYCDDNSDKRITLNEWIECTHINERSMNVAEQQRRRGRNPFSTVLKS